MQEVANANRDAIARQVNRGFIVVSPVLEAKLFYPWRGRSSVPRLEMQMGFEKTARERTREYRTEPALKITNPRIAELESSMNLLEMPKKGCQLWQRDRRLVPISIAHAFSNSCI